MWSEQQISLGNALTLSFPKKEDQTSLTQFATDFQAIYPAPPAFLATENIDQLIEKSAQLFQYRFGALWKIENSDQKTIGIASLYDFNQPGNRGFLKLFLLPDYIAESANILDGLSEYLLRKWQIHQLEMHFPAPCNQQLLEQLSSIQFQQRAVLRDFHREEDGSYHDVVHFSRLAIGEVK